jgi:glyoxylate/hydroxypyruvate reductase A
MSRVALLIRSQPARWAELLRAELPGIEVLEAPDGQATPYVVAGKPPPGSFAAIPGLRAIFSINAGIEHLLTPGEVPEPVAVVRLSDPTLATGMRDWALAQLLAWHRQLFLYREDSLRGAWTPRPECLAADRTVLVLGAGSLGAMTALGVAALGFRTRVWSRRRATLPGIEAFAEDELGVAAQEADAVISLLPLTPETRGVLAAPLFARLRPGALLVNGGRGAHVVEEDLLAAIAEGRIGFAALDVFAQEPLPEAHAFWRHPRILVSPHVAAPTHPASAARHIAANLRAHLAGAPLRDVVDRARGY